MSMRRSVRLAGLVGLLAAAIALGVSDHGGPARGAMLPGRNAASNPHHAARPAAAGTSGLENFHIRSGGRLRSYLLYVPPGDTRKHRLPLVLVYHGADGTDYNDASATNLLSLVEQKHDMIVAYLQGYEGTWNDDAGNPPAEAAGVNDVLFTQDVLSKIESHYSVDMRRVVITGFSNGAILAELLGCRIAANLTMIVPVEGQMAPTFSSSCRPRYPVSVYEWHAFNDPEIPYAGGTFIGVGGPVQVLSAPDSVKRWAALDKCATTPTQSDYSGGMLTTYAGCRSSVTVTLNSTDSDTHGWPTDFGDALVRIVTSLTAQRSAAMP